MESSVKLIAITQPVDADESAQDLIAYCARVSNPKNQDNKATAPKLLDYLMQHKHWSPFEMVNMVIEIVTTRDIGRQILRHDFKFQEFSQRYAKVDPHNFTLREARLQDPKNRQASIETEEEYLKMGWIEFQLAVVQKAYEAYEWAISKGIAKEQARAVLPEGLTMSRMYVQGTLRNWIHYVQVRTESGTQKEHRSVADAVLDIIHEQFPALVGLI